MEPRRLLEFLLTVGVMAFVIVLALIMHLVMPAHSAGWSLDPTVQKWWKEDVVKRCCSLADGFEADEYESTEGGVWATITDDGSPVCWKTYDEESDTAGDSCRRALPTEKRIYVPQEKIIYEPRNPTGHGILFLLSNDRVLCYFLPSGA